MSFRKQLRKLNPLSYLPLVREVLALRSRQGPYRFVVRQWSGINDLNLASRVMETEYFKQDLIPVALPVREVRSILVLAPHQDDEAIGAGGALILASAAGVPIHIVFVTDGEEHGFFNIIESPVATILNNIGGTEAVLKMAAKKRKTVLVVSTSEVYGKSQSVPFREDGDLVSGPTSIPMPGELRSVPREAGIIEPLAVVWTPRRNLAAIPPPYPRSLRRCHCPA